MSNFAAFGYSASSHIDADDSQSTIKGNSSIYKNNPDSGQWTNASVLPKAVAKANRKKGTE